MRQGLVRTSIVAGLTGLALPLAACGSSSFSGGDSGATSTAAASASTPSQGASSSGGASGSSGASAGSSSSGSSSAQADAGMLCPPPTGATKRTASFPSPPPMCIEESKTYTATMKTDVGDVTIKLDAKDAPKTVNNFVFLARNKFYDGLTFHRVIQGFMIQGGDPQGTGQGGPGYQFEDETPKGQYQVGSIAMANSGPNTNGSQFFIVTGAQGTSLPPQYNLFGQVTKGMDVLKKIEADGAGADDPTGQGTPKKVHKIESVTVAG